MKPYTPHIQHVTQSPMNAKRWLLILSCDHQVWVTRARRPRLDVSYACPTCRAEKEPSK